MSSNNYSALNDKEFEELSRDLLAKREGVFFESFKKGKDRGIDLRHTSNITELTIIVQAKHFVKSGLSKLLYQLKNEELDKVKSLNPNRYILTTTVSLNESDKEKIKQIFSGYIHNTSDIIGQDDLDALLIAHPDILKSHHKLYITNLAILNKIINNHITSRSLSHIKEIQKSIHLYVTNKKYEEAVAILNKQHFLIITGEPGIGKTSLANYITHQHLADGFTFIYILSDITDAEKMLDDDANQLFYFDDFLG
ncbi:MAG: restriction endonuclease, partial [Sediminibacterium sp.]|nr:restriction endonuclease [Sediminibacterium sp.]